MLQKITFLTIFIFSSIVISAQRYLTEVFPEVAVDTAIVYGQNISILNVPTTGAPSTVDLKMDVYSPVGDTETNRPVILYIHSGQYLPPFINGNCLGTRKDNAAVEICTRLAKMGYVAASIDYRLGWNPLAPSIDDRVFGLLNANYRGMQDTRTCLRYFRKTEAEEGNPYGIDPNRAILWGDGVGGSIVLSAATVNSFEEFINSPVCVFGNGISIVIEEENGDIYGTSLGMTDNGLTLCLPNHVGYSSDFNLSVNSSGYLIAEEWLNQGDVPMISFHGINDQVFPYDDQIMVIPTSGDIIIEAFGSQFVQSLANDFGNNQVFLNANIQDGFTNAANELNEGLEGLFPFILGDTIIGGVPYVINHLPWNWVDEDPASPPPNTLYYNCNLDEDLAQSKIDTLIGYFAPRAFAVMCFGCQEFTAQVFVDENENGVFDGNDAPLPNIIAEIQPNNLHANSNNDGQINVLLPTGDYSMTITPPMYYEVTSTPYPVEFSIDAAGVLPNNVPISVVPIPGINDLTVSLLPLNSPMPGFENSMKIIYKNQGTTTQSGTITLNFADAYTLLETIPMGNVNGTTVTWETADLAPFETGEILLEFYVSEQTPLSSVLISDVNIASANTDETPTDNFSQIQQIVIGSYDPNDKAVNPSELSDDAEDRYLTYLIRFQNTGTAPAVNIRVEDTLSQYLDINSLEMLDVSHDYRMEVTGDKNIAWHFDDIFLPDSTNNEPESHGHIAFWVKTDLPVNLPDAIDNQAFIYFDFNEAVLTNVAKAAFLIDGVKDRNRVEIPLQLFPNPAKNQVRVESIWPVAVPEINLEILDIHGKLLQQEVVNVQGQNIQTTLNLGRLPSGIYQIRLFKDEFFSVERLVKVE